MKKLCFEVIYSVQNETTMKAGLEENIIHNLFIVNIWMIAD